MAGDFFSWIGDSVRSAGDFIFGEDGLGLDFKDVLDAGRSALGSGGKDHRASNNALAQSLMSRAMDNSKANSAATKGSSTFKPIMEESDTAIFKDRGSNDPWMSTFRRLVEGTKTL